MASKERKRKEYTNIGESEGQVKDLLQSYHGGYVKIKLFLILILAVLEQCPPPNENCPPLNPNPNIKPSQKCNLNQGRLSSRTIVQTPF